MKKLAYAIFLSSLVAMPAHAKLGKAPMQPSNFSGVYECKGNNDSIGDYTVKVTLKIDTVNSKAGFSNYTYAMQTENGMTYNGYAVIENNQMASSIYMNDKPSAEMSVGVGSIKAIAKNRFSFTRKYFEPTDNEGTIGLETCMMPLHPLVTTSEKTAPTQSPAKPAAINKTTKRVIPQH